MKTNIKKILKEIIKIYKYNNINSNTNYNINSNTNYNDNNNDNNDNNNYKADNIKEPGKEFKLKTIHVKFIALFVIIFVVIIIVSAILIKKNIKKKSTGEEEDELNVYCPFGYFLSEDDTSECIQCNILNCYECKGTKSNIYSNKCNSEFFIPYDSINKINCEKCSLENCKECQGSKNDNICILCSYGFYEKKMEIIKLNLVIIVKLEKEKNA